MPHASPQEVCALRLREGAPRRCASGGRDGRGALHPYGIARTPRSDALAALISACTLVLGCDRPNAAPPAASDRAIDARDSGGRPDPLPGQPHAQGASDRSPVHDGHDAAGGAAAPVQAPGQDADGQTPGQDAGKEPQRARATTPAAAAPLEPVTWIVPEAATPPRTGQGETPVWIEGAWVLQPPMRPELLPRPSTAPVTAGEVTTPEPRVPTAAQGDDPDTGAPGVHATVDTVPAPSSAQIAGHAFVCPRRLRVGDGDGAIAVPYCGRFEIDEGAPLEGVERLVIAVPGIKRNAADLQLNAEAALALAGDPARTLIVAPQFLTAKDLMRAPLEEPLALWDEDAWIEGARSERQGRRLRGVQTVSSFEVVDLMLARIVERGLLPDLTEVVVFGHSAGGQFVQRHASSGPFELGDRVNVSFVVANPSSYLYFDGRRPDWATGKFRRLAAEEVGDCDYDRYRYGLRGLSGYVRAHRPDRARFLARPVSYLLGDKDDSPRSEGLDHSCAAELQGPHRLARGLAYWDYLGAIDRRARDEHHRVAVLADVGHNVGAVLRSACGGHWVFGVGTCEAIDLALVRRRARAWRLSAAP